MQQPQPELGPSLAEILAVVQQYWGFNALRPLQKEAIRAQLDGRDSVVVLPTGGGKSLCYQVPPILDDRLDIVVSPLISLMKDQVDGLRACGYPAAAVHSGLTPGELEEVRAGVRARAYRLLFVSPERLLTPRFLDFVDRLGVRRFAVDEAHCISHWGHDFRQEYRQLAVLKQRFPQAAVHAYTATATERVRRDLAEQLQLREPQILVGNFDRPNLTYRVVPRTDIYTQVEQVIRRHAGEAVIVYCLSRRDTEELALTLRHKGIDAQPYHAGLEPHARHRTQDAFAAERLNVVIATVAFGMGIDRSNVRCVVHATLPKSIEHYQQETGRAGRDGLEAECVLFYSAADVIRWENLIQKSAAEADDPQPIVEAACALLDQMRRFATVVRCRHRGLVEYFGQSYDAGTCGACDVCLDETEGVEDATDVAQKIISAVARVEQRFGVGHVVDVLLGADTEPIRRWRHEQLAVHGLLSSLPRKLLMNLVYQLVDQGLLDRTPGDRPVLTLNDDSWAVLRNQRSVRLLQAKTAPLKTTRAAAESWEGVDRGLFEHLRALRRTLAEAQGVPAFVVFGDATLRDLARRRPSSVAALRPIRGIGAAKTKQYGAQFIEAIADYCAEQSLDLDAVDSPDCAQPGFAESDPPTPRAAGRSRRPSRAQDAAFALFAEGTSIEDVAQAVGRRHATVVDYLADYIRTRCPDSIAAWVDDADYERIAAAAREVGTRRLKPIRDLAGGDVSDADIRAVVAHLEASDDADSPPA